jgi:prenylcysteine oxidase/farnesylcysteine lyase
MFEVRTNTSESAQAQPFDNVFFAAPWHSSPISKSMAHFFDEKIPYVYALLHR